MEENQQVQTQETIANAFATPEGEAVSTVETTTTEQKETVTETKKPESTQTTTEQEKVATEPPKSTTEEFKPSSYWDLLKEEAGDNFKMPENITADNELELYKQAVKEVFTPKQENKIDIDDPFIARYLAEREKENFNMAEFIESMKPPTDVSKMTAEDKIRLNFKQKFGEKSDENLGGITDTEIEDYLRGKSRIEKEELAMKAEQEILERQKQEQSKYLEEYNAAVKQKMQAIEEQRTKELKELFDTTKDYKDILGVPVSGAEMDAFNPKFINMVTPDESGVAPIHKMLQSNEILYKIAYLLDKGEPTIRDMMSKVKTEAKNEVLEKLNLKPTDKGGITNENRGLDPLLWSMPEK